MKQELAQELKNLLQNCGPAYSSDITNSFGEKTVGLK